MASIDKMYGTKKEYLDLYWYINQHWFSITIFSYFLCAKKIHAPSQLYDNAYERDDLHYNSHRPISNFSRCVDAYLMLFCNLSVVRRNLNRQYSNVSKLFAIKLCYYEVIRSIGDVYRNKDWYWKTRRWLQDIWVLYNPRKHLPKNQ